MADGSSVPPPSLLNDCIYSVEPVLRHGVITAHSSTSRRQHIWLASGEIGPPSIHRPGSVKAGADTNWGHSSAGGVSSDIWPAPQFHILSFAGCCHRRYASRSL